jgi:hypothetical protein
MLLGQHLLAAAVGPGAAACGAPMRPAGGQAAPHTERASGRTGAEGQRRGRRGQARTAVTRAGRRISGAVALQARPAAGAAHHILGAASGRDERPPARGALDSSDSGRQARVKAPNRLQPAQLGVCLQAVAAGGRAGRGGGGVGWRGRWNGLVAGRRARRPDQEGGQGGERRAVCGHARSPSQAAAAVVAQCGCQARSALLCSPEVCTAKGHSLDADLAELHLVGGQGAGLVAEHVLHLRLWGAGLGLGPCRCTYSPNVRAPWPHRSKTFTSGSLCPGPR